MLIAESAEFLRSNIAHDSGNCATLKSCVKEVVAIESFAVDRNEQISLRQSSGIDGIARSDSFRRRAFAEILADLPAAELGKGDAS